MPDQQQHDMPSKLAVARRNTRVGLSRRNQPLVRGTAMMMACVAGLMVMMMALSVAAGSVEAATIEDVARSDDRGNKIEDGMLTPVADHHLDKQAEEAHAPRRIKGIAQTKEVASPESIAIRSHDTHSERGMGAESTHERRRRLPDTSLGGAFCEASPLWDQRVDESSYEIGCEEISDMLRGEKTFVGHGYMRDVYLVDYEGRQIVLKTLRSEWENSKYIKRVDAMHRWEAAALDAVRGHPNVVGLLGLCNTTSSASEYYEDHLDTLLQERDGKALPIWSVVQMALDAARGLQALHEAPGGPIVHFDLKPQQLLLDTAGTVKVNDLNMCRFMSSAPVTGETCPFSTPHAAQPRRWRAPENMAGEVLTEKADIYSMSMIFYYMISGMQPFEGMYGEDLRNIDGEKPFVDREWHRGFMEIVEAMWVREPSLRPSAGHVVLRLERLQRRLRWDY